MRGATLVRGREISSGALVDDADGAAAEEQEELRRKTRTSSSSGEDGDDVGDGGTGAVVARAATSHAAFAPRVLTRSEKSTKGRDAA